MARKVKATGGAKVPAALYPSKNQPQIRDVLSQVGNFLADLGYGKTLEALQAEAKEKGISIDHLAWSRLEVKHAEGKLRSAKLMDIWEMVSQAVSMPSLDDDDDESDSDSEELESEEEEAEGGALVDVEAEETSDDSSDEDSDSSGDSSAKLGQKRKRVLTPESSSDSSSDEDSNSDGEAGKDKAASSESDSDSDSSSAESDERPVKRAKTTKDKIAKVTHDSSSDSDLDSSSSDDGTSSIDSSNSDSGSSSNSNSDSGTSSDSDSDSPSPPPKKKSKKSNKTKKPGVLNSLKVGLTSAERTGSATSSSATLAPESPVNIIPKDDPPKEKLVVQEGTEITEVPATSENIKRLKKQQVAFSRIPADQKVDPRFSSNAYVSYDYADRAFRDLSVTKGKGFTKEKNKKKRGSYRGGAIDLAPKAIKFDD